MTITEPAWAKLNLTLDILGKRPDGYHDLRMVMQSIDLKDTVSVTFKERQGITLVTNLNYLPRDNSNIAVKAAELFFRETGIPPVGITIRVDKRVPVSAGMAGGSSDGAAVLRILRRVLAPELPEAELEAIALRVGSDVPYCVRGGTALAEGRGEVLTDLPPLPACFFVVCKPPFPISTPELFAQVRPRQLRCHPDTAGLMAALSAGDLAGVCRRVYNVFEDILPRKYRAVGEIRRQLMDLDAGAACMTGSGPTVFGIFTDEAQACRAAEHLRREYPQTFLARPAERFAPAAGQSGMQEGK